MSLGCAYSLCHAARPEAGLRLADDMAGHDHQSGH